jgi:hypothetical protein
MKSIFVYLAVVLLIVACTRHKCPPCSNCNITTTYQVVKTGNDTLYIDYRRMVQGHYEECALYVGYTDSSTFFLSPGTYTLKADNIVGGEAYIRGISKEKGWAVKVISTRGAVLATTENKPYRLTVTRVGDSIYENAVIVQYE